MINTPIRVLIVDDHDMLREGLVSFLKAFPDLELVGEAANGSEAVRMCLEKSPDVVLMDLLMPEMDGVSAIQVIHKNQPEIHIIALSSFGEEKQVKEAMRTGATSYLIKNISATRLAEAIRAAHAGLSTFAPEVANALIQVVAPESTNVDDLTDRELEVLRLLSSGLTNAEIAFELHISKFTVKNHVSNLLSKLGVSSRTEAVSLALKENIVH